MAKPRKKTARLMWNFEPEAQRRIIVLAQLGRSSAYIEAETGFSPKQIMYALSKAKNKEGYESGHTYRSEWRNGTSFAAREVEQSLGPILMADAEKRLPKLFEHPTARMSPDNKR